jgi:hypothetical protein
MEVYILLIVSLDIIEVLAESLEIVNIREELIFLLEEVVI